MARSISACLLAVAASFATSGAAFGQFSSDPFALPAVGDLGGDQTQSKVRMMPDGSFYVSWFDNRSGGYDVYLQRYNAAGVEQWPHNGVLIADRSLSSTQDYDMRADSAGNAVLVYRMDANTIQLTKVDATGSIVWSSAVSPATAVARNTPRFCILSDGNYMVGWSEAPTNPSAVKLQKVNASGTPTGALTTLIETLPVIKPYTLCELQPGEAGSCIALWVRSFGTGATTSKYLHAQKFDSAMTPLWPDVSPTVLGVAIYDPAPGSAYPLGGGTYSATQGGSIQIGYFPTFEPDGSGGAVFSWYENAGLRLAFVQQVSAAGVKRWATDYGRPVTDADAGFYKISASSAYDAANNDIYVSYTRTNTTQNQWGTNVQKIDAAGNLAWGALGTTVSAPDANQESFVQTALRPQGGCYVLGLEGRPSTATSGVVQAALVDAAGSLVFTPAIHEVCSNLSSKGRLWVAPTPTGGAVMTFNSGGNGGSDVLLANIRANNTQGTCPADLGRQGGLAGPDGRNDNNDFIVFIDYFFAANALADLGVQGGVPGQDGAFDNNDFVVFIDLFFAGCD